MKVIWRVFRYEFLRQIRRRGYILSSLGIPLLMVALFYGVQVIQKIQANNPPAQSDSGQSDVIKPPPGVNLPGFGSPLSEAAKPAGYVDLAGIIKKPGTGLVAFKTEDEAKQALEKGDIRSYYLISSDYLKTGQVDMYFERFNLSGANSAPIRTALLDGLRSLSTQKLDDNVIHRLQDTKLTVNIHQVNETGKTSATNEATQMIMIYVFVMMLMFTAFTSSGYMMQSVVEEKENRMVEILLSSMRPRDLLAGKFVALSVLSLAQMALWFGTAIFLLNQLPSVVPTFISFSLSTTQIVILVVYFILGFLFFCAAYAAIGALANNMREGPQMAVFVTLPAIVPLYAIPVFATSPNGPLAVVLSLIPVTAPIAMVARISLTEVPMLEVIISVVLLIITVAGTVWFAARVFRVNTLLAGRVPSLRDLIRLVRERA